MMNTELLRKQLVVELCRDRESNPDATTIGQDINPSDRSDQSWNMVQN